MTTQQPTYHVPVLLHTSVDALSIEPDGVYVDVTFGGGGHSREILRRLGQGGRLIAFDQDKDAIDNRPDDDRLTLVCHNFRFLADYIDYLTCGQKVDGILGDLGVSSHHFDCAKRGFSFRTDGPLDMRMNQDAQLTATDIVGEYDEAELTRILRLYGEVDNAHRVAKQIVAARQKHKIATTHTLCEALATVLPRKDEKGTLAKVFQALRIEVNHEMDALCSMLRGATDSLQPGGRLVMIAYHSLEDRMVKNVIRTGDPLQAEGETDHIYGGSTSPYKVVTRKPIVPSEEEVAANPRARSARLRVAERLADKNKKL